MTSKIWIGEKKKQTIQNNRGSIKTQKKKKKITENLENKIQNFYKYRNVKIVVKNIQKKYRIKTHIVDKLNLQVLQKNFS